MAIALVGRPNVGKSSLFNRLIGSRDSLIKNEVGVTRERLIGRWFAGSNSKFLEVWDLAGWGRDRDFRALSEAQKRKIDLYLLVIDGSKPLTAEDHELIPVIRRLKKPVLVVVNKQDQRAFESFAYEIQEYLKQEPLFLSAETGEGVESLKKQVLRHKEDLEWRSVPRLEKSIPRVLLLGQPNVGKSSLLNRLGGTDLALVSDKAGTTRDIAEWMIKKRDFKFRFVDSAGVRKKGRIFKKKDLLEIFSVEKTLSQLKKSDACLLLIEATSRGVIPTQDKRLLRLIKESKTPALIAVNKWDEVRDKWKPKRFKNALRRELLEYAHLPIVLISAKTGFNVDQALKELQNLIQRPRRIPTSKLNQWLHRLYQERQPRIVRKGVKQKSGKNRHNKYLRFHYMTQLATRPMRFCVFTNAPQQVPKDEKRFLENELRQAFELEGLSIDLQFRSKKTESKAIAPKR